MTEPITAVQNLLDIGSASKRLLSYIKQSAYIKSFTEQKYLRSEIDQFSSFITRYLIHDLCDYICVVILGKECACFLLLACKMLFFAK